MDKKETKKQLVGIWDQGPVSCDSLAQDEIVKSRLYFSKLVYRHPGLVDRIVSRKFFFNALQGVTETFTVCPPENVVIRFKNPNDRLRRAWVRTGRAIQLAIDQYEQVYGTDQADQTQVEQSSYAEQYLDAKS